MTEEKYSDVPLQNDNENENEKENKKDTQEETNFIKLLHFASDTFTPFQIKILSKRGKKYMGSYGLSVLIFLIILNSVNAWGQYKRNVEGLVIANFFIVNFIAFLGIFKIIAAILHALLPHFK